MKRLYWKQYGGYNEKHQLINLDGKIVGEVLGSTFNEDSGWTAFDERKIPPKRLGRFTGLTFAKAAVERALSSKEAREAQK